MEMRGNEGTGQEVMCINDENIKGEIGFVIDHIWWLFISWIWYKNILFRCLGHRSFRESRLILFGIVFACCGSGILLEMKKQRNGTSVLMNLLAGYGLYAVLTYYPFRKSLILILILTAAVLSVVNSIFILCRRINNKSRSRQILKRRMIQAGWDTRDLFCAALAAVMVVIGFNAVFGTALFTPSTPPARQSDIDEQTIANNLDTLVLLREEKWSSLSVEEKLNVLQTIANIEQRYLGLPDELNVGTANLREDLAGYYSDATHQIIVSMDSLMNDPAYELTDTIAHEAYHSFQHRMVEAYDEASDELKKLRFYHDAALYKKEFADYTESFKDFCGYYDQKCESEARRYAESAAREYFEKIEAYAE